MIFNCYSIIKIVCSDIMKKEKKSKQEKKPLDKEAKKKRRKRIILIVLGVLVLFFIVMNLLGGEGAQAYVTTTPSVKGEIEQTINTSGTVTTEQSKVYFSDVSVKIGSVNVEAGDAVKAGDVLIAYDADAKNVYIIVGDDNIIVEEVQSEDASLDANLLVDFTIILGEDFDGRYVRD